MAMNLDTKIQEPQISIILPVFNAGLYLREAIDSVLDQSLKNYELIIINDGSTDLSESIIQSYTDERIWYIRNEENLKLIRTLNKGIELARAKYILRMDADDVMLPERLKLQYAYMEANPHIAASGGSIALFGAGHGHRTNPADINQIKNHIFFEVPIFHPTAIIRRDILIDHSIRYDVNYPHAEDYKFWYDILKVGGLSNIKETVLKYRITPQQVSAKYNSIQLNTRNVIRKKIVNDFLVEQNMQTLEFPVSFREIECITQNLRSRKFSTSDKEIVITIVFICYMSLPGYNINRLWYFLTSFLWLAESPKNSLIIIASTILKKRWRRYAIY